LANILVRTVHGFLQFFGITKKDHYLKDLGCGPQSLDSIKPDPDSQTLPHIVEIFLFEKVQTLQNYANAVAWQINFYDWKDVS
jgi:hypothetical protein